MKQSIVLAHLSNGDSAVLVNGFLVHALEATEKGTAPSAIGANLANALGVPMVEISLETPSCPEWTWVDVNDSLPDAAMADQGGTLLDKRRVATVLAALRYWQREGLMSAGVEHDIASDGDVVPLSASEIDTMCEDICLGSPIARSIELESPEAQLPVPSLQETVARMQREIVADVRAGRVRAEVASFGALHDFVDANAYGGFCEDKLASAMIREFGGRSAEGGMPQGMLDLVNTAQEAIDQWIQSGQLARELQEGMHGTGAHLMRDILQQEAAARAAKAIETKQAWCNIVAADADRQAEVAKVVQRIHAGFAPHADALSALMLVGGKFGTYALGSINTGCMTPDYGLCVHVAATTRPDGSTQVKESVQLGVEGGDKPGTLTVRLSAVHYQPFYRDESLQHFDAEAPVEDMLKAFLARIATFVVIDTRSVVKT